MEKVAELFLEDIIKGATDLAMGREQTDPRNGSVGVVSKQDLEQYLSSYATAKCFERTQTFVYDEANVLNTYLKYVIRFRTPIAHKPFSKELEHKYSG